MSPPEDRCLVGLLMNLDIVIPSRYRLTGQQPLDTDHVPVEIGPLDTV